MSNELDNWYVASLVVQVKPTKIVAVKHALSEQVGTEIHAENSAEGKLVVVMEADFQPDLVKRMDAIKEIDGVIAVSFIYSYQDEPHL